MQTFNNWAATVGLTVVATFLIAMNDASYRPAFIQIATMAILTTTKSNQKYGHDDSDYTDRAGLKEALLQEGKPSDDKAF
jgi:hypothetical protein